MATKSTKATSAASTGVATPTDEAGGAATGAPQSTDGTSGATDVTNSSGGGDEGTGNSDTGADGTGTAGTSGTDVGAIDAASGPGTGASGAAVASTGAGVADSPVGSDGLQAPATAVSGAAQDTPAAPASVSEMLAYLEGLDEDQVGEAIRLHGLMGEALSQLQASRQVAAGAQPAGPARAVIIYGGVVAVAQLGDLVEGDPDRLHALAKSGDVDTSPVSVAAAEARGVRIHQLGS